MRFLYLIFNVTLQYVFRVFFSRLKVVNSPKEFYGSTIYVSNHPSSFMDPLVVAGLRRPIIFFLTRSDVFSPLIKPLLWAVHMFPIYRQLDGEDLKAKNKEMFAKYARVLSSGRNLLLFGEGFTDDTFIRRLKPVKKGGIRIGFATLEQLEWKKKIYIAGVGCNYTDPKLMRSDLLISTSEKICLNDYKEEYLENSNKTITELTRKLGKLMQEQITHVQNSNLAPFHENIMQLTRKGMHPTCSNTSISLEKRWRYSQKLANWFNEQTEEQLEQLSSLRSKIEVFSQLQHKLKVKDADLLHYKDSNGSRVKELLFLIFMAPFALLGLVHCGIFYAITKRFVEKSFKRKVFWSSVKMMMGKALIGLFNIPIIFLFYHFVYPSYWLGFAYYAAIGLFGLAAYMWRIHFRRFMVKGKLQKMDIRKLLTKREELANEIQSEIPVA